MIHYILVVIILCWIYITIRKKYDYWIMKGIKGPTPLPIFGTFGNVFFVKQSIDAYTTSVYRKYPKEKVVGLYAGVKPILLIRDLDLIKQIMIKDFACFHDRGVKTSDGGLSSNLFGSEGETWKVLRPKLTPVFTSKKIKEMLPFMKECVSNYINYVDYLVDNKMDHEMKNLMAKYTLSVMGSCAYGVRLNVYSDEMKVFKDIARRIFVPNISVRLWYVLELIVPGINNQLSKIDPAAILRHFFMDFTNSLIRERKEYTSAEKNFVDLLIALKKDGRATRRDENGVTEIDIDDEVIASQIFVFFAAGYETSSTTMAYLLYELAMNQKIQDRVYEEICRVLDRHNGDINDESLNEMAYLNMVFDETLRKHPVLGFITRRVSKNYTLPGTNVNLDKGTIIFISNNGLHNDESYFPNPDEFNPDNFSEEKKKIPNCAYMPFGIGPRQCIGIRFARLQSLMAISAFLKKFKVEPHEKTPETVTNDPRTLTLNNPGGIWVKISRRDNL